MQLFETPWTVAHQAPLFMGILQAKILECVALPSSRGSSQPRDRTQVSHIAGGFSAIWATREVTRQFHFGAYTLEKVTILKDTCAPMFTAALLTIAGTWKQPRCPSTEEWIQKVWHIQTQPWKGRRMNWVSTSEVDEPRTCYIEWSQKEKNKCCILMHTYGI